MKPTPQTKKTMISKEATYVTDTTLYDPILEDTVQLEIWRDPATGLLFAIENEFIESSAATQPIEVVSPYRKDILLRLRM